MREFMRARRVEKRRERMSGKRERSGEVCAGRQHISRYLTVRSLSRPGRPYIYMYNLYIPVAGTKVVCAQPGRVLTSLRPYPSSASSARARLHALLTAITGFSWIEKFARILPVSIPTISPRCRFFSALWLRSQRKVSYVQSSSCRTPTRIIR